MAGKLVGTAIVPGSVTVAKLANDVSAVIQAGGGPKVISVGYPGDDTAANSVGAQTITVTGTGFNPNVKVFIGSISGGTEAPTVSRANANSLSFTTPALTQGLYQLYVVNSDGGVGTFPRFQVSGDPAWVTSSSLGQFVVSAGMNKQLEAISDSTITYTLANGSSLPAGTSLASNGLISGTLTSPPGAETTYNFSVVATDQENQNSERAFSYTGILFTFSISPAVNGQSNIALTTGSTLNLTTNGAYTITPLGDFSANVQVWGAGGGGYGSGTGGGGGYSTGIIAFKSGVQYNVVVGSAGASTPSGRAASGAGAGSGIEFKSNSTAIIVAGGGGGSAGGGPAEARGGGGGGGTTGQNALSVGAGGYGGTQSAAGAGGNGGRRTGASGSGRNGGGGNTGSPAAAGGVGFGNGGIGTYNGGDQGSGGGGGGYWGGGEGGGDAGGFGGGGGSGYINTNVVTSGNTQQANYRWSPNTSPNFLSTFGNGGLGTASGNNGAIIITGL
jgi:hypothetical protein